MVSEKKYWKKRNRRTDKIAGALDQALGISETTYHMPKSFNGSIPPAYSKQAAPYGGRPTKPTPKKKKSKSMVIVIDTQNPNKIKIRGFKVKQKQKAEKASKKQNMTMYGL